MKKGLISKLNKERIEHSLANLGYSISEIGESPEYFGESAEPSKVEYSYSVGAPYKIKEQKGVWDKIKKFAKVATFTTALGLSALGLSGCPSPYDPIPTGEPTTEATAQPSPTPKTDPTAEPTPVPQDYIDISGYLEDIKYHEGKQGTVVVYDTETENRDGSYSYSDKLGEFSTDGSGHFSFSLEKLVNPSDKIYVRAVSGSSSNPTSYTRTIELDAVDNDPITVASGNPAVRVTSYPSFCSPEDYKEFRNKTNESCSSWETLPIVKIWKYNEDGSYALSDEGINNCIAKIENSENIPKLIRGADLEYEVEYSSFPSEYCKDGYIYVIPNNNIPEGYTGGTYVKRASDREILAARIEINTDAISMENATFTHEMGHGLGIAPDGEAGSLENPGPIPQEYTIMYTSGNVLTKPGEADEYAGYSTNEETYVHTDPYGMDNLTEYTLGMSL